MLRKILKFKLRLVVILVVSLVLIQLVTSYFFGYKVEDELNLQFKQMTNSPYLKVLHYEYHRGLFISDSEAEITINNKMLKNLVKIIPNLDESSIMNTSYVLRYKTTVDHGIFSGIIKGYFVPTLAVASTDIEYSDSVKKVLDKFFNNKKSVTINNVIYLNHSGQIYISSPSFNYEEALSGVKILWGGLRLNIFYNKEFNKFSNKLEVPLFSLIAPTKGKVTLSGISYTSNSKYSKNNIKVGSTNLNIKELDVILTDKAKLNFKFGDVLNSLTGISAIEFLNEIDVIDPTDFKLSKLFYSSISSDENNYFNARARVKFESFVTESNVYGPLNLDISTNHVLSMPFSQLVDSISKQSVESDIQSDQAQAKLIATLKEYFGPILVDKPSIILDTFELDIPSGKIRLSGYATTNNFLLTDMNSQQEFLRKIRLDFTFSVPKKVLSYLLALQMSYYLSAGNTEMDKQSSDALKKVVNILLDNQINTWKKKGYIKENDGILSSNILYDGGKVTLK